MVQASGDAPARIPNALMRLGTMSLSGVRLTDLFEQAPGFMAVLSGREHRIELANPGCIRLVGGRDVLGRTVAEALPDVAAQGYVAQLDQVFDSGEAFSAAGALYGLQAEEGGPIIDRFLDFVFQPIRGDDGAVAGIFVQGTDVTDRVRVEQRRDALVQLSDLFREAHSVADLSFAAGRVLGATLGVSRVGFGTIQPETDTLHVERDWTAEGVDTLEGATPLREYGSFIESLKAGEFISIGDVRQDERTAAAAPALEGRHARSFVNVPVLERGRLVAVVYVNCARPRDWTPEELAFIREVADRTRTSVERARSEASLRESAEHLKLMVLELNHRVKNNLSIVQSIIAQTLRADRDPGEARESLLQRIKALAVAHDVLTREQWEGLGIEGIAGDVLGALEGSGERIVMSGEDIRVTPKAGLALAMALHELGVNAVKYGALSTPEGQVTLTWAKAADGGAVTIRWIESGGPTVAPPSRRGFGTRLLQRGLAAELEGAIDLDYPASGVTCTITGHMAAD